MRKSNLKRELLYSVLISAALTGGIVGCAVQREQSTTGQYIDDSVITTRVKAKFVESKVVDAGAINVETLKGVVQLSGFAKSGDEKATASDLAKSVDGVVSVHNDIIVRP